MAGTVICSQTTMRLMVRIKHYMRIPMVSLTLAIIVLGVSPPIRRAYSWPEFAVLLFALGCGLGPMYPMSTLVTQNSVKPHQMGTATGALNFFRTLGGALIVAVFGALVLGGVSDGSGVMTLEKIATQSRRSGAGVPECLHRRHYLYCDFLVLPVDGRGTADARAGASWRRRRRVITARAASRARAPCPRSTTDSAAAASAR